MSKKSLGMLILFLVAAFAVVFLIIFTSPHNILIAFLVNILLSCLGFLLMKIISFSKFAFLAGLFILLILNLKIFNLLEILNFALAIFLFLGITILIK